ncbi:MAG: UvrD-helicase domain-containing protein [Bacteroidales bacterium]|nr:UvrD-helicase domain-containing protein [Bacteroidales bacterium]
MRFLEDLNSRQQAAVTATEGRVRVIAGAGTGKTKALTYRYAYLVNVLGIDPANILCLTFTNKAAAEMRSRIALMVHSGDYNDFVCTLHGFCVKFLRKEIYRLGFPKSFTILDEEDAKTLAKECMDELGIKRTEKTVKNFLDGIGAEKALNGYIEAWMLPGSVITDEMRRSGNLVCYLSRQMKGWALDFDDLMNFTLFILDRFPDAREYWQDQLNYIMVDEAQDCNTDDWNLIEKLGAKHRNIFVVGDPDQCIYEWRGAKPAKFVQFASDTDIVLDENYRSTPKILDIANCVIANNRNRIPKDLFTRRAEGPAVIHFHGRTEKEETDWIVARIRQLQAEGASLQDIAILYRSTYQSRAIEQALLSEQLAYVIWGGIRFFERREIKDTLAYLRLLANPDDDLSFLRIVNVPSRKLGRSFQDQVKAFAAADGTSLYRALQTHLADLNKKAAEEFVRLIEEGRDLVDRISISDLMNRMLDASGLKRSIREDQDEDRLENLDELLRSVRFYEQAHEGEDPSLASWLQDIALYTNADYRKETRVVKLMTIHQAKGLEFPYVFIVGLSEGIFPNMRTIREYKKNGEEEERRLMYVAITRAEKALFLTESEGFNIATKMSKYPSRFLAEIKRNMVVVEGNIPEELWRGTRNLVHVLDEENFIPDVLGAAVAAQGGADGFGSDRAAYNSPFQIGQTVSHAIFGEGTVLSASDDFSTFRVQFADGSVRHLRASFLHLPDLPE